MYQFRIDMNENNTARGHRPLAAFSRLSSHSLPPYGLPLIWQLKRTTFYLYLLPFFNSNNYCNILFHILIA